ncbi:MAG: hypothetical protein WCG78_03765 [Candidatus Omnitrophota bacterium]
MRYIMVSLLCVMVAGCGTQWQKKFVRKKAANAPGQVFVYEPKEYQNKPNAEIYQASFLYWKAWQQELVERLGDNKKRDSSSFDEALKNLDEMKNCLNEAKRAELDVYMRKIAALSEDYKANDYDTIRAHQLRQDLSRLSLAIDKSFRYNAVKNFIK